ncbi:MAG: LysM peptidoglycan-binding domain-containing protein [Christensenellales bacterium]
MDIHVVKAGDTLYNLARRYGVGVDALYTVNELGDLPFLVVGQTLVIPTVEISHTVREGESLYTIARRYGTTTDSIIALNTIENPDLIQPGTVLRIPVREKNYGFIEVNGYIEPSTAQRETQIIQEVGEYLTYISPFSYQARADGSLVPLNDAAILAQARAHRIAALLVITNFSGGNFDTELVDTILDSAQLQDTLIRNMISVLREKGYYGVNIDFERISPEKREEYNSFLRRVTAALHPLNYAVSTALVPKASDVRTGAWHGAHDYAAHGEIVDFVIIMTYEWGWSGGPPYAVAPIDLVEDVISYAVSVIPSRKIMMGMPLYGYDWQLPYMPDARWARRVSPQQAVALAAKVGARIRFDEQTQSPTFRYFDENGAEHEVWFEDARSVRSKLLLVNKYDLRGVSYWVLGLSFPQNWVVLDGMFNIVKVIPPTA